MQALRKNNCVNTDVFKARVLGNLAQLGENYVTLDHVEAVFDTLKGLVETADKEKLLKVAVVRDARGVCVFTLGQAQPFLAGGTMAQGPLLSLDYEPRDKGMDVVWIDGESKTRRVLAQMPERDGRFSTGHLRTMGNAARDLVLGAYTQG